MSGRSYVGRHRAPPPPSRPRLRVALCGGALLAPVGVGSAAGAASAAVPDRAVLGAIAQCESGGNPRASNGTHFGLFQFDLRTWASVGGKGHPLNASVAEQTLRAGLLLEARGTQPWVSSRSCWAGRPGGPVRVAAPKPRAVATARTAPRRAPAAPRPALSHAAIRVKAGDTLSQIAAAHHVRVSQLHGYHSGNPNMIYPGERLTIR